MKRVLFVLMLILCISNVAAISPVLQVSTPAESLNIVYSNVLVKDYNSNFTLFFDVLDSNYTKLDSTDTDCSITISIPSDGVSISEPLSYNSTLNVWYKKINYTACPTIGQYAYYIYCNNTLIGQNGFVDYGFYVTENGRRNVDEDYTQIALIVAIGILGFLFLYFAFKMDETHFLLKLLSIFFALYTTILLPQAFIIGVESVKTTFVKIPGWFFRIFALYFIVYIFYYWTRNMTFFQEIYSKVPGLNKKDEKQ